ncbi:hypothetical protein GCM10028806_09440 [Spirosoma terrae]|uniref:DUF4097 domain-containing protein n=1 Tax=Spirosoma terrae TaxID=1968276 RepID=A0A6L9L638_9BACT|nr:DUF4097 family beta strand repeat-containing protein [Spirosoma terrae]NDU95914.1 DUF4097 domain-containing protein [Spirosoma terrae]
MKTILILAVFSLMLTDINAQDYKGDKLNLTLEDSSKPGLLAITWGIGDINIQSYEGKQVQIDIKTIADANEANDPTISMSGMKKTLSSSNELQIENKSNAISIKNFKIKSTINLTIKIPKEFSIKIKTLGKGSITIKGVSGLVEVSSFEGDVKLDEISGSVSASNTRGNLTVNFTKLESANPTAISTLKGNIDIGLPSNTKTTIRLKASRGDIKSDFPLNSVTNTKPFKTAEWLSSSINGGGGELTLTSFIGSITVRKK